MLRHFIKSWLMALAVVMAFVPGMSWASPFQNGSFEIGTSGENILQLSNGNTTLTGWTVFGCTTGNLTIENVRNGYVPGWISQDGNYSVDLNGVNSPGGIQQTFDTIVNQTYIVSFYLSGNPSWSPTSGYGMRVSAAGVFQDYFSQPSTTMTWTLQTFTVTAVSASTTLSFLDITTGGSGLMGGPALDNVSVALSSIPEPATLLLLAFGLTGLAGGRMLKGISKRY